MKVYRASRWSAIGIIGDPAQKTVLDEAGFLMEAFTAATWWIVGNTEVGRRSQNVLERWAYGTELMPLRVQDGQCHEPPRFDVP